MDQCAMPHYPPADGLSARPPPAADLTSVGDGRREVVVRDLPEPSATVFTTFPVDTDSQTSFPFPITQTTDIIKLKRFSVASFSAVSVETGMESLRGSFRGPEGNRGGCPLGTDVDPGGRGLGSTRQGQPVRVRCSAGAGEPESRRSAEANESKRFAKEGPREAWLTPETSQPRAVGRERPNVLPRLGHDLSFSLELQKANFLALTLIIDQLRSRYNTWNEESSGLFGSHPECVVGGRKWEARDAGWPVVTPKRMVDKATTCDLIPTVGEPADGNGDQVLARPPPVVGERSLLPEAKAFPKGLGLSALILPLNPLLPAADESLPDLINLCSPFFTSLIAEEGLKIVRELTVRSEEVSKSADTVPSPGCPRLCSHIEDETLPGSSSDETGLRSSLRLTDPRSQPPELSVDSGRADKDATVIFCSPRDKPDIWNLIHLNETQRLSSGQSPAHEVQALKLRSQTVGIWAELSPARASDPELPVWAGDLLSCVERCEGARGGVGEELVVVVEGESGGQVSLHRGLDLFESEGNHVLHNNLEWLPSCASTPLLRPKPASPDTHQTFGSSNNPISSSSSSADTMKMVNTVDGSGQSEASAAERILCGGSRSLTQSGDKDASEAELSQRLKVNVEATYLSNPAVNQSGAGGNGLPVLEKPEGQSSRLSLSGLGLVTSGIPLKKTPKSGVSPASVLGRKVVNSVGAEMPGSVAEPPKTTTAQQALARGAGKGAGMRSRLPQPMSGLPVLREPKGLETKPAEQQLNLPAGPRMRRNPREEEAGSRPPWRGSCCRPNPGEHKHSQLPAHKATLGQVPGKTVSRNLPGIGNCSSQRFLNGSNPQNNRAGAKPARHSHLGEMPARRRSDNVKPKVKE